jgi:hypothetical protein
LGTSGATGGGQAHYGIALKFRHARCSHAVAGPRAGAGEDPLAALVFCAPARAALSIIHGRAFTAAS